MPAPVIPFSPAWGTSINFTARNVRKKHGLGGVEDKARDGLNSLNSVSRSWSVTVNLAGLSAKNAIETFLKARKGIEPFTVAGRSELYTCEEWSFDWLGVGVWKFTATFEQAFRLGV